MPDLDEYLRNELRRTIRPVDVNDLSSTIDDRRTRRTRARKIQSVALTVVVLAGTIGGVAMLSKVFREPGPRVGSIPGVRNGLIVYSEIRNAGEHLWVVNPDGTGARQLTTDEGVSDSGPSVSPDGRTIAFVRTDVDGSSVYTIGIDGSGLTRITPPSWSAIDPAWAPDGIQLAFAGDAGDGYGIYVMAATIEGAAPHRITDRHLIGESDPSWSPDGSSIAFSASTDAAGDIEPHNWDVFVTPADGSGSARNLTDTPDLAEVMPAWSPVGGLIAFVRAPNILDGSPRGGIATMASDGSNFRMIVDDGSIVGQPAWAPDGTQIVFDRADEAGTSIWAIAPDGLTRLIVRAIGAAWQPVPSGLSSSPAQSPTPTGDSVDLGLGFPVCNVRSIQGDFDGNGQVDTAFLATKTGDVAGCPQAAYAFNVLGVDLTGDRRIDMDYGPIECQLDCTPFMAIDINEDGSDELLVEQLAGAILGLVPYTVGGNGGTEANGVALFPMSVLAPGDPDNGFPVGEPPTFYVGGDEGFAGRLGCRTTEAGRLLVVTTGQLDSIEHPKVWTIRRTIFSISSEGWYVEFSETFDRAVDPQPSELEMKSELCGHPYPPNGAFAT